MSGRRPKAKANLVDNPITPESDNPTVAMTTPTAVVASDVTGRLALLLATFALSIAIFLIALVAIAASNA